MTSQPIACPIYQLRPWVLFDETDWRSFQGCNDARVAQFIDDNWDFMADKMEWTTICHNPAMLSILDKRWQEVKAHVKWDAIVDRCTIFAPSRCEAGVNPYLCSVLWFLDKHWEDVDVDKISSHVWQKLFRQPEQKIIDFIDRHWPDVKSKVIVTVYLRELCKNSGAVSLIDKHWAELKPHFDMDEMCMQNLLLNKNAFMLLEKRVQEDKLLHIINKNPVSRYYWMQNPCAISFIEKHLNSFRTCPKNGFSRNPAILTLDYTAMRQHARPFAEELAARVFTPARVTAWDAMGIDVEDL